MKLQTLTDFVDGFDGGFDGLIFYQNKIFKGYDPLTKMIGSLHWIDAEDLTFSLPYWFERDRLLNFLNRRRDYDKIAEIEIRLSLAAELRHTLICRGKGLRGVRLNPETIDTILWLADRVNFPQPPSVIVRNK